MISLALDLSHSNGSSRSSGVEGFEFGNCEAVTKVKSETAERGEASVPEAGATVSEVGSGEGRCELRCDGVCSKLLIEEEGRSEGEGLVNQGWARICDIVRRFVGSF